MAGIHQPYGPGTGTFAANQALTYPTSPTYAPVIKKAVENVMGGGGDVDAVTQGMLESMGRFPAPPPSSGSGGGGGGGGGGGAAMDPRYWSLLEKQYAAQKGLLGQQAGFAKKGFSLLENEAQVRRRNMQRMFEMQKQRLMGLELPQALRTIGNEAAARGSFMSQSRILGQKEATQGAQMQLAERFEENRAQVDLLNESLKQASLRMDEELARVQTQQELADIEYQIALLRKG